MRDGQGVACHKTCAEATADTHPDQTSTEVLPLNTGFDLTTVRRAA
jgi:hypothetical protein